MKTMGDLKKIIASYPDDAPIVLQSPCCSDHFTDFEGGVEKIKVKSEKEGVYYEDDDGTEVLFIS